MAKHTGFMEYTCENAPKRSITLRIHDFKEFDQPLPQDRLQKQAARCMDCGIPHCHVYGCPVQNRIPDWNDLVYRDQWQKALEVLHSTDNFPEFTGRVCPAPCEAACTLSIDKSPVSIRQIELQIIERGWREGWIKPEPASFKSGKKVAIVGSGPAGLAAAQQLSRSGHEVVVFERADRIGGLLRYGIPDFKLEKWVIDRRLEQMQKEGVIFETRVQVGKDISARYLQRTFDAIIITAGATEPRDLKIPGRELEGVHFAMDFLTQQNKINAGDEITPESRICAKDKQVVVIGGGDTGSDCVGTSNRQGAARITQIELLPMPRLERTPENPWPTWPQILRTSSSQEEGCSRDWSISTKEFVGQDGKVTNIKAAKLNWSEPDENGKCKVDEIPDSEFSINADLVLLSAGFVHVEHGSLVKDFDLKLDERGNIKTDSNYMTSVEGVFAGGDAATGASLVVRAIHQGRQAAKGANDYVMQS